MNQENVRKLAKARLITAREPFSSLSPIQHLQKALENIP